VGWNPVELGGSLDISGSAWVEAFGRKIGAGVSAHLAIQLPRPLNIKLDADFTVELPWPLPDQHFSVPIFKLSSKEVDPPLAALAWIAGEPIGSIHRCSGLMDKVEGARPSVWPDVSFEIPLRAIAAGPPKPESAKIVNGTAGDGFTDEGGIAVSHRISELKITKLDEAKGTEESLPNVSAAWLGMNVSGRLGRSSRLAIPCNDPLPWLQSFQYGRPGSIQPIESSTLQVFGTGPEQTYRPPAKLELDHLTVSSGELIRLVNLHWISPYDRALVIGSEGLAFEVHADSPAGPVPQAIKRYELRIVSKDRPALQINAGHLTIAKVRELASGFIEWSAVITRIAAEARQPLTARGAEHILMVVAIGYLADGLSEISGGSETVLSPGVYRLYLEGISEARGALHSTIWPALRQEFRVVPPPLRPYLRYATFGDERIFGLATSGWNPNPAGLGFGHYRRHCGVVRARVGYLSQIYPRLWVSPEAGAAAKAFDVKPCTDGSLAGSQLSHEWSAMSGGAPVPEQELLLQLPTAAGVYAVRISRSATGDGARLETVDEWTYRVSHFALPRDHLKPAANAFSRAYGPFGVRPLGVNSAPDLPVGTDFDAVAAASLSAGWALPAWIRDESDLRDPDAGLAFYHLVEWSGFFSASPSTPEARLFSRPDIADLNLLMDASSRPTALLLRSGEPCDWRRVEITLLYASQRPFDLKFATRIFPSPDGCACMIIPLAESVPVRLPRGTYGLRLRYRYKVPGLAWLVDSADPTSNYDEFTLSFDQLSGRVWNV
jgi:hypothetical protein